MELSLMSTRSLSTCKYYVYIITLIILQCNYIFMCLTPLQDSEHFDVLICLSVTSIQHDVQYIANIQVFFIKLTPQRLIRVSLNLENYSWAISANWSQVYSRLEIFGKIHKGKCLDFILSMDPLCVLSLLLETFVKTHI